ncbi:hypothetical protein EVAR_67519_1 [Eumeta japonica]|uniref:Uncharacterized protein n=1 Tax=Eumeta variegata TaxID=151549 RepID=A0A4C1YY80_EUMVA|nr:hypothetical protein EVAR_67519_1 [Eumeta japonica]
MSQTQSILDKHLGMKKPCSPRIPCNLTEAQKKDRVTWCKAMLPRVKEGASNLVWDIVAEVAVEEYEKHDSEMTREEWHK